MSESPNREELFEIVDAVSGQVIGTAPRSRCHGDPSLIHRSVHVVVFHPDGESILLQKRSRLKDIQPGKWDTAVGGHLSVGEDYEAGARREMAEEIGLTSPGIELEHLFDYPVRNELESENVRVFGTKSAGPFVIQESELDAVEFHRFDELEDRLRRDDTQDLTPVLCKELRMILSKRGTHTP